jgi:zeaxanthin glucosyltransferase
MKTILFELFPAKSHHLMAFKKAKLLSNAGYRVVFGSLPIMRELIELHGFDYCYVPIWIVPPLEQKVYMEKKGISLPSKNERIDEVVENLEIFNQQIARIKPDIVLIDRHLIIINALFYKNMGIPVAYVCAMPDPERRNICCSFRFSKKYTSYLWFSDYLKLKLKIFKYQLTYPDINDLLIYRKFAEEFGFDPKEILIPNDFSGYHMQTTPRIVLSATDLDFQRPEIKGVFNIGPLIDLPVNDNQSTDDNRYEAMKKILTKGKSSVVYCSLGMLVDFCTKQKISLYRKIKEVALLDHDDYFVICTGDDLDNSNLLPLPPNLFVFKNLPQKDMLKHCSIMINHGGLNSITECIFNEVPVIAYPPSQMADHSSNSAKLVYHGLGLRGKIWRDSPKAILKKINQIRTNNDWYVNNIRVMKQKFEKKNNSTEVVNIIESIIEKHGI